MTAREFLNQPFYLNNRINDKRVKLDCYRQMACSVSSPGFEEHYSSNRNTNAPFIRYLEKADELEEEIAADEKELERLKTEVSVAIDELDSGIFEYLLGEILRIISEKGNGQLIFTSHNLRPLETIDKGFIAFTTTNVNNRYIRFSNVKNNNNLRDFYYRDIILGEQDEPVYETTNNYEIALAFREAGDISGS